MTSREYGLLLCGDNVVEVYIGYLRRKLDVPFGLQTLSTVRGLGYRLDSDLGVEAATAEVGQV